MKKRDVTPHRYKEKSSLEKLIECDRTGYYRGDRGIRKIIRARILEIQEELGCTKGQILDAIKAKPRDPK